ALYRELTAGENAMLRREGPLFPGGLPAEGWQGLLLEDSQGRDHGYLSWTRVPERDDGVGLEVHEALGRTRADRSELLRSLGSWSTVTELVRVRLLTEDPLLDVLPGGRLRPDPQVLPLVMMRVIGTAAALRARAARVGCMVRFAWWLRTGRCRRGPAAPYVPGSLRPPRGPWASPRKLLSTPIRRTRRARPTSAQRCWTSTPPPCC